MKRTLLIALIICLAAIQMYAAHPMAEKKRVYVTHPINPHPPKIDGKLDDPVWKKVPWEGNFIQREPLEGENPSQNTAFKILYDDKFLYVAIRAFDTEPDKIVKRMARRDNMDGDWVGIDIDSYFDKRTAFSFRVNAAGVKEDRTMTEDGGNIDSNWDPIWKVKTAVDDKGWVAEMRIPFNQLRFASKNDLVWGLQLNRMLFRKEEFSNWQFIPKDASGWVQGFGELRGIAAIKSKGLVQLLPYTVGKTQRFEREEGNPFATGKLSSLAGGLDGKIGITSDLTLDFTINPDFGQVEADPSEVNLTAFETYFHEKRPFFIEGSNILSFDIMGGDGTFSQDNLFYSRRIGRSPHHSPDINDDEFMDFPANTSILGAFKITGKTRSGLSIGILDGLTSRETAQIDFQGQRRDEVVEPFTNYLVMRVQKDYRKGNTILGGMFTSTHRSLKDPSLNFLHKAAYSGGLDFYHTWKKKTYYFSLKTLFSHVRGDREAILETQESPLRYYQRPDATHLSVDPNRTSLTGHGGTISFGKQGSGHFRFSTGVTWRSPGLELNDVGYLYTADVIMQWSWIGYRVWKPLWIFKEFGINFNQWKGLDFAGTDIFGGGNINGWADLKNSWGFNFGINRQDASTSTTVLRGGPSLKRPGGWGYWANMYSDRRKSIYFNIGSSAMKYPYDWSTGRSYWGGVTYRPGSALSISLYPSLDFTRTLLQYVDTLDVNNGGDNRYLMASIDQKTVSLTIRLNYSITPELSIQFYGQPFISAGRYTNFKYITQPHADTVSGRFHVYDSQEIGYDPNEEMYTVSEAGTGFSPYSFENPNFNFMQFRSNLVIRWEYSPGSTVYLVWSQGRTDTDTRGEFNFGNDIRNLFRVQPHNVFLIKFTYRFNL
jgi:hypothetical protein